MYTPTFLLLVDIKKFADIINPQKIALVHRYGCVFFTVPNNITSDHIPNPIDVKPENQSPLLKASIPAISNINPELINKNIIIYFFVLNLYLKNCISDNRFIKHRFKSIFVNVYRNFLSESISLVLTIYGAQQIHIMANKCLRKDFILNN